MDTSNEALAILPNDLETFKGTTNYSWLVKRLAMSIAEDSISDSKFAMEANSDPELAKKNLAEELIWLFHQSKTGIVKNLENIKSLETKEVYLAIFGTFIWAFGDWVTNFLWHCEWKINC